MNAGRPPAEIVAVLRDVALRRQVAGNDEATATVHAQFVAAGLSPIVLKGPATRALMGSAGDRRPSTDVDLLVAPTQWRASARLLRELGYQRVRGVHADSWAAPGRTPVDLHWTLARLRVDRRAAWEVLEGQTRALPCAGTTIRTLAPGAGLVHLAIHVTQNDSERPLADLRAAAQCAAPTDVADAVRVARLLGAAGSVAWAFERAGLPEVAAAFGAGRLDPNTPSEAGLRAFLTSPVSGRERARRLARLAEGWVRFHAGRLAHFLTGRSATNARWAARLRRGRS